MPAIVRRQRANKNPARPQVTRPSSIGPPHMNYRKTLVVTTIMDAEGIPPAGRLMLQSAFRHGIEVHVVGQGLPFENWWLSKCVRLWDAIGARQEYDHIVFAD